MSELFPVPRGVIEEVNRYIEKSRSDLAKYENLAPFDQSANYSLHQLARSIYASGWSDGHDAQRIEDQGNPRVLFKFRGSDE